MNRSWVGFLLLLSLTGCPDDGPGKGGKGRYGGRGPAAVSVAVEAAKLETVRDTLIAHAALEPEALVKVPPRASGEVKSISVEEGAVVTKGQVLLELDSTRVDLQVREAQLALKRAQTSLARTSGLAKKGLATNEELEQAKEAVDQARLAEEAAALDKADMLLRSPISGVVTERFVTTGDTVDAATIAFHVADRDPLLVRAPIPEADAGRVVVGKLAWITAEGQDAPIRGKVIRVAPIVNLESGTVVATVAVEHAQSVVINSFASVEIVVAERANAITIPQSALALRGEEDRVLVCEPGKDGAGVVRQRAITVGVRNGERVEVTAGLKAGEQVVVAAPDDLRDGAQVRVIDRNAPTKTSPKKKSAKPPESKRPLR